jgi:quercetin dioxygenase-like cupin family protein
MRRSHAPVDPPAAAPGRGGRHARAGGGGRGARPAARPGHRHPTVERRGHVLACGTVAHAERLHVAGIKLATRGPVDVATVQVTFQPGGSTGWHVHPGPTLVAVKSGKLTLHRAKGCRSRTFSAGQTFVEFGPDDVNLTRNETGDVTETLVTFLLPVGAPVTVDAPAPGCRL